jgi:hypothetical protein
MRWFALLLWVALLLALAATDASAQTNATYPYAAAGDTVYTGFAYVPRTFDITKGMPSLEKWITAEGSDATILNKVAVTNRALVSVVGDGDGYKYYFKNGHTVLGVDTPDTVVVVSHGDGTGVLVTVR